MLSHKKTPEATLGKVEIERNRIRKRERERQRERRERGGEKLIFADQRNKINGFEQVYVILRHITANLIHNRH